MSIHSCVSIHVFQFLHFNSLVSIPSFQFLHFKSVMSSLSCQFTHVNSFISIHSCQFMRFNSCASIPSFQFMHVMQNISFHFISIHFFPTHHESLKIMSLFRNFRPGACRALPGRCDISNYSRKLGNYA